MDDRRDLEAWADALLDQHRTAPARDPQAEAAAAQRAMRDLTRAQRWMLTRGGRQPDLDTVQRIHRASRRHAMVTKWYSIFVIVGVALLLVFGITLASDL